MQKKDYYTVACLSVFGSLSITFILGALALVVFFQVPHTKNVFLDSLCANNTSEKVAESFAALINSNSIMSLDMFYEQMSGIYSTVIVLLTGFIGFLSIFLTFNLKVFSQSEIEEKVDKLTEKPHIKETINSAVRTSADNFFKGQEQAIADITDNLYRVEDEANNKNVSLQEQLEELKDKLEAHIKKVEDKNGG